MHTASIQMPHACVKPESNIQGSYRPKVHAEEYPNIGSQTPPDIYMSCFTSQLTNLRPNFVRPPVPRQSDHVILRVVHHSALPLRWSSVVHGLKSKLPFIPSLKLLAILRPLPNIKRLFRRWALRALQQPIGSRRACLLLWLYVLALFVDLSFFWACRIDFCLFSADGG